jgi:uncharacterized membrane-anchored protein YhcB (DUF1043 family)
MLDALYRAERYRELAEEFRNVAETCASTKMQNHYSQISKHYSTLAVRHFCNYRQAQKRLVALHQSPIVLARHHAPRSVVPLGQPQITTLAGPRR